MDIDTYVSHLWFFKAERSNASSSSKPLKVLAIPEESLQSTCNSPSNLRSISPDHQSLSQTDSEDRRNEFLLGPVNRIVCSLCKFILRHHSRAPLKIPCPHFRGEAKLSVSDLDSRSKSNCSPSYIYTCDESTHCRSHSLKRRDIYLVEPFYNLRERCFIALGGRIRHTDIVYFDLPISLQRDYLEFITTLTTIDRKLGECVVNA